MRPRRIGACGSPSSHRRWLAWATAPLLLATLGQPAVAHPNFATDCSTCHGNTAKMDSTPKSGSTLAFGKVLVGGNKSLDIKITNTSTATKGGGFAGTMPAGSGPFSRSGDGALAKTYGGFLLPAGIANTHAGGVSSATFSYLFAPTERGTSTQNLAFTPSAGFFKNTAPTANFTLTGQGVAPLVSLDASQADLGSVRLGTTSLAKLIVNNLGDGNQAGAGLGNLSGTVGAGTQGFSGQGGSFNLADGASQTFDFAFTPAERGAAAADVDIHTTNGSTDNKNLAQDLTARLSAVAVGPILSTSVRPTDTLDFGKTVGPLATVRSLTLTNATPDNDLGGLTNLSVLSAAITGTDAGLFSLKNFTPGAVLSKSQALELQLQFLPGNTALGPASATLTIVTDESAALGQSGRTVSFTLAGIAALESYWKAGGGTWNSKANWVVGPGSSVTSADLPNAQTDVFFAASDQPAVSTTLGQDFTVRSLNISGDAPPTTIAGNQLTLREGIRVGGGSATHTISAQMRLAANQEWNIGAGSTLAVTGSIGGAADALLSKSGAGRLVLEAANTFAGGTSVAGGTLLVRHAQALPAGKNLSLSGVGTAVVLAPGLAGVVRLGALSLDDGISPPLARFDLGDNRLVLDARTMSTALLRSEIAAAFASGTWTGPGLGSSTAAAAAATEPGTAHTAVGYASNTDFGMGLATFGDQAVDATSLLVRYTLFGDANLDSQVDLADFAMLRRGFGLKSNATWSQGDFNYDGVVDLSDFALLRQEFGLSLAKLLAGATQASALPIELNVVLVPEPSSVILAVLGAGLGSCALACRARRAPSAPNVQSELGGHAGAPNQVSRYPLFAAAGSQSTSASHPDRLL